MYTTIRVPVEENVEGSSENDGCELGSMSFEIPDGLYGRRVITIDADGIGIICGCNANCFGET
jgi:hypothetical protein